MCCLFLHAPYWRLPFDKLSPFDAISATTGLVIGLDLLDRDDENVWQDQLWALDVKRLHQLLDSFDLQDAALWQDWWMVPKQIEQGGAVAYTFIGNGSTQFVTSWKAASLGTPMNYGDGDVYGFGIDTDDPLYFGRAHNLFVVGQYPFQIEETLSLLKHKNDAWGTNTAFQNLKTTPKEKGTYRTIIHSDGLSSDMPDQWMPPVQKRTLKQHFDWLWLELNKEDTLGVLSAYLVPKKELATQTILSSDWQWISANCQSAVPLHFYERSPEWSKYIAPWIGEGGWELTLNNDREENEIAGEIWVLPIADTSLYTKNYAAMMSDLNVLERIDYQRFQLIQLDASPLFSPLSDRKGLQIWLCELDGVLLCAVSMEDMERWLDYYMVGGQIDKETDFLIQQQALGNPKKAQLLWRWDPLIDKETNLFKLFFPREGWANSGQLLANIETTKSNILTLKGSIQPYTPPVTGPSIAWTLPLNLTGQVKLFPVKDIYSEETIGLAIQDESDYLVFIDGDGNILWERPILAPILGALYAIPWHNSIMHLLATTTEGVFLWDENGAKIDQLPLISSPPSSGMTIAHFSQKNQVGIFIPTIDGQIWGFTPEGELLEGWPVRAYQNDTIVSGLLHYQLPTRDLIASWADSSGWKIFDRQGELSFDVKSLGSSKISPPFGQQLSDDGLPVNNRLVMTYDNGIAQIVSFSGETFNLPLGKGPADHFLFSPIWGDARSDYIVQRGRLIHLFGYEETEFSERWQAYFTTAPDMIIDMAPYGLMSMNNDKKEIWLLDGDGQLMTEFPLAGEQNAFLLNTSTQENLLLTLLDKELYAYHLKW